MIGTSVGRRLAKRHQSLQRKKLMSLGIVVCLLLPGAKSFAGPRLDYAIVPLNLTVDECLQRAVAAVASEHLGGLLRHEYFISAGDDKVTVVIDCAPSGRRTISTIMVASDDAEYADYLWRVLDGGMRSGIFD